MRSIQVTSGSERLLASCDDNDFDFLSRFQWWLKEGPTIQYAVTRIGGQMLYMHHFVLMNIENRKVNHRDRDGLNNQRQNLRVASAPQVEAAKVKSTKRTYTSQFKGVCKPKGKTRWLALVKAGGVTHRIGTFEDEEDAARAYDAKAREVFGEFAFQNFPTVSAPEPQRRL